MTDIEYEELKTRVAQGKKFLDGKWSSSDWEDRRWKAIWYELSDQLLIEMKKRKVFSPFFDQEGYLKSAEEKIEKLKLQMKGGLLLDNYRHSSAPLFSTR
jgi:hypothetical protein